MKKFFWILGLLIFSNLVLANDEGERIHDIYKINNIPKIFIEYEDMGYNFYKNNGVIITHQGLECADSKSDALFDIYHDDEVITFFCSKPDIYNTIFINSTKIKDQEFYPLKEIRLGTNNIHKKSLVTFSLLDSDGQSITDFGEWISDDTTHTITDDQLIFNIPFKFYTDFDAHYLSDFDVHKIRLNVYPLQQGEHLRGDALGYQVIPISIDLKLLNDPGDPGFVNQYYLHNMQAQTAWDTYHDLDKITVAVLDDGVGFSENMDLKNQIRKNKSEIEGDEQDNDKNGYTDDKFGWNFIDNNNNIYPKGSHGTNVAGIIAAQHDNDFGIKGIATNVDIMPVIVCDIRGCDKQAILSGMYYAVNNGAKVINISLGGREFGFTKSFDEAIKYANDHGVIVVAAGGNGTVMTSLGINEQGVDTSQFKISPVCNDIINQYDVIGVGALDLDGQISKWSNYGQCIDIRTYGEGIFTSPMYGYQSIEQKNGTSFAAPQIAGMIALGAGLNPDIQSYHVYQALMQTKDGNIPNIYKFMQYIEYHYSDYKADPKPTATAIVSAKDKNNQIQAIIDKKANQIMSKIQQIFGDYEDSRKIKIYKILIQRLQKIKQTISSDITRKLIDKVILLINDELKIMELIGEELFE